jgi:chromate transport protein ChrA
MLIEAGTIGPGAAILPTQLSSAVACGYIMWLLQKAQSIPWVSQATTRLNVILRLIASGISTIGISVAWEPANHQLIIGNLTAMVVIHGLYHLAVQYATTHGFEKLMNIIPSTSVAEGKTGEVVPTTEPAPSKD